MPGLAGSLIDRAKYRIFETRAEFKEVYGVEPPPYDETKKVKNWAIPAAELVGSMAPNGQDICMIPDVLATTADGTPRTRNGSPYVETVFMPFAEVVSVNIPETRSTEMDPAKMKPDQKQIGTWMPPINPPGPDEEWVEFLGGVDIVKKGAPTLNGNLRPGVGAIGVSADISPLLAEVLAELKAQRVTTDNVNVKLDSIMNGLRQFAR